jgi:uncharacterized linocin/CFP29 family protein
VTDRLYRDLAPISQEAWGLIDEIAAQTLSHFMAGRALVDFEGPRGWEYSAEPLGRVTTGDSNPAEGVHAAVRVVAPLVEMRTPFTVDRAELDMVDRGRSHPELADLRSAARRAALAEDTAVFYGYGPGGIEGIAPASPHESLEIGSDYNEYPGVVARAVAMLRGSGIGGPYAIALGPRCYTGVIETTEHGGYPLLEHIKLILGGRIIWAPAVDGAVVLSVRGGDYSFVSGGDFSIGYTSHTEDSVRLYLEESFTLLVHQADAAVALRYPG